MKPIFKVAAIGVVIFNFSPVMSADYTKESKNRIAAAQRILSSDDGFADGKFGPNTAKHLREYQNKHGLEPTGKIDIPTALTMKLAGPVHLNRAVHLSYFEAFVYSKDAKCPPNVSDYGSNFSGQN